MVEKNDILRLIAEDKIKSAIDLLMDKNEQTEILFPLSFHSSRLLDLQKKYNNSLISWDDYVVEKNKIVNSLLQTLKDSEVDIQEVQVNYPPIHRSEAGQWLKGGIVIIVLISLGHFFSLESNSYTISKEQIVTEFLHTPINEQTRTLTLNKNSSIDLALKFFSNGEYHKAISILESLQHSEYEHIYIDYLLSNLYMKLEQPRKAIPIMEDLLNSKDIRFRESTEWNLALAILLLCNELCVNPYFRNILERETHPFHKEAVRLSRSIKFNPCSN
ncbi:MAG: hypothetical protein AAFY76_02860 [Cyanobacteria bacterium J06649_11]